MSYIVLHCINLHCITEFIADYTVLHSTCFASKIGHILVILHLNAHGIGSQNFNLIT